jgi:peroxiredoxin
VLPIGTLAPDFELPNQHRQPVRLSSFLGQKYVVLAFHPLAFTPVCSAQMQTYERERARLDALDAQVLAVSLDAGPSKKAWCDALGGISYEMLSDFHPHGRVAAAYGVLRDDGLADRAIFVVDKAGVIRWTRRHEIPDHPDLSELLQALASVRGVVEPR